MIQDQVTQFVHFSLPNWRLLFVTTDQRYMSEVPEPKWTGWKCILRNIQKVSQFSYVSCWNLLFSYSENHLEHNRNLMPMALLEMGLTKFNAKNYAEAEIWLKKAQKCRRYFFKMIIHFRAHSALQCIKQIKERELLRIAGWMTTMFFTFASMQLQNTITLYIFLLQ